MIRPVCHLHGKQANVLTHRNRSYDTSAVTIPPDSFNEHFVSLPSRLLQSLMGNSDPNGYVCTSSSLDFCSERRGPFHAFHIPLLCVYEVGKLITGMDSRKSMRRNDIPARLLKFALPYIVESLTYICNLCIQKSVFPKMFNTAKVVHLPKNIDRSDTNNLSLFLCCLCYQSRLKGMSIITYLIVWRITAFFTVFRLDLDHSTRVTLLCLNCVTCGYLLLIAQR